MLKLLVGCFLLIAMEAWPWKNPGGGWVFRCRSGRSGANPAQLDEELGGVTAPAYRVDDLTFPYLTMRGPDELTFPAVRKSWANVRMVACWNETGLVAQRLNSGTRRGDFLFALNDPARVLAEGKFASEQHIGEAPLPLPRISIWTS